MRIKTRAYPHPVLSPFGLKDFVKSAFQPVVEVKGTKKSYIFKAHFKTKNASLLALVADRRAQCAVHIECPQTRYRSLFTSFTDEFEFEIDSSMIAGSVDVCSFLLAAAPIAAYTNTAFHPDYAGLSFEVGSGDTLAVGDEREFIAEKKSDPLRTLPSIFSIQASPLPDAAPIDTQGNKIAILLSEKNYEAYRALRADLSLASVLGAAIVAPALAAVIEQMRTAADPDASESMAPRHWFGVLERRLLQIGIRARDPESFREPSMKIANQLIGQPLEPGLASLLKASQAAGQED